MEKQKNIAAEGECANLSFEGGRPERVLCVKPSGEGVNGVTLVSTDHWTQRQEANSSQAIYLI